MKTRQFLEPLLYAVIVILASIVIALVAMSPEDFKKAQPVYKGF